MPEKAKLVMRGIFTDGIQNAASIFTSLETSDHKVKEMIKANLWEKIVKVFKKFSRYNVK